MKTLFLALCGLLWFCSPSVAAECLQISTQQGHIHIAEIDLRCDNLTFIVSAPEDNGLTVSQFAVKYHTDVAINGSFFRQDLSPIGLTVSGGKRWENSKDFRNKVFFACDARPRCWIEPKGRLTPVDPKWQIAISGWQSFDAKQGKFECADSDKVGCKPNIFEHKHPRTMIGLNEKTQRLYLVVVEGRQLGFSGMSLDELAALATRLQLTHAVNLDGGGSATMVEGQTRRSALPFWQGSERAVANHFGVKVR